MDGGADTGIVALPFVPQNPYQRLLYEALASSGLELRDPDDLEFKTRWLLGARGTVSVLHFHWPQCYYTRWDSGPVESRLSWLKLGLFAGRLAAARALGYRIVWTVHEVLPHEPTSPALDRAGARILARASHALIAHDAGTARKAAALLGRPARKLRRMPHGSYAGVYPPGRDRAAARRELGVPDDAVVLLSFGHIRRYKGLSTLLAAFAAVDDPRARLVIAGLPMDDPTVAEIRAAAAADPRVVPVLRFVPDAEVAELFEASDAAVYARADGGTSGALVLALSLGRPAVVADTPDYRELTGGGAAAWLFDAGDAGSLAAALDRVVRGGETGSKTVAAAACAERDSWPRIAEQIAPVLLG